MDPLTIATGIASLVKVCSKLFTIVRNMGLIDKRVSVLAIEIESLKTVLVAVADIFNDPIQAELALSSPISLQHWKNIQQMLMYCKDTLTEFERLVESVNQSEFRVARKTAKFIAFTNQEGQISLIRQKLTTYRAMLTMSLQSFTLFVYFYFSESNFLQLVHINQ
jgi:hypothetical protein